MTDEKKIVEKAQEEKVIIPECSVEAAEKHVEKAKTRSDSGKKRIAKDEDVFRVDKEVALIFKDLIDGKAVEGLSKKGSIVLLRLDLTDGVYYTCRLGVDERTGELVNKKSVEFGSVKKAIHRMASQKVATQDRIDSVLACAREYARQRANKYNYVESKKKK